MFDTPIFSPFLCGFIHITPSAVKYSKLYLPKAKLYICNILAFRIHVFFNFSLFPLIYVNLYKTNKSGGICLFTLNSPSVNNTRITVGKPSSSDLLKNILFNWGGGGMF